MSVIVTSAYAMPSTTDQSRNGVAGVRDRIDDQLAGRRAVERVNE